MFGRDVRTNAVSTRPPVGAAPVGAAPVRAPRGTRRRASILADARGSTLIEFAVLLPVMLMLTFGIISYAWWFLLANGVLQAANDGARAAIAGLDAGERRTLAVNRATDHLRNLGRYDMQRATIAVSETSGQLTITVSYDAGRDGNLRLPFVPAPPSRVVQRATILLGGL